MYATKFLFDSQAYKNGPIKRPPDQYTISLSYTSLENGQFCMRTNYELWKELHDEYSGEFLPDGKLLLQRSLSWIISGPLPLQVQTNILLGVEWKQEI